MKQLLLLSVVFFAIVLRLQAAPPAGWTDDYQQALDMAQRENKVVLLAVVGSDWCGHCQQLRGEVFNSPVFMQWAKENVVLLQADFPRHEVQNEITKTQNANLMTRYGFRAFPTTIILDATGKELGRTVGYPGGGGPEPYVSALVATLLK